MKIRLPSILLMLCLGIVLAVNGVWADSKKKEYYVYQYVVENAQGTFEELSDAIENSAVVAGWKILAKIDAGVPEECPYRARVFVLYDAPYGEQIMKANPKTGPFAILDRINLFEDENGIHVSVVNPHSINRTILMDDETYEEMSEEHLQALRKLIISAVPGTVSEKGYGEKRKKGYIGRTMGVMAGGKFEGKVKDEFTVSDRPLEEVVAKVREGLSQTGEKWGMHLVYQLALPEYNTYLFGTTGTPMDSKSFSIVKAGSDKSRKKFKCPGLAHAAAYPIEVTVVGQEDGVRIRFVNIMYRMKMYFEDAGKMAFMKNMGMPGSIAGEIKNQIKSALVLE